MDTLLQSNNTHTKKPLIATIKSDNQVYRAQLKTREIVLRSDTPKNYGVYICSSCSYILSENVTFNCNPKRDFNHSTLKNLSNTRNIIFYILERTTGNFQELEIPTPLSEKIGEYLRNMQEIESNEQYRLPNGLPDYPVNCKSFVYYIKSWFENTPKLSLKCLINEEDGKDILPGDILYAHEGDEGCGEYWHYMIYIGNGFCISKNGPSHLVITRHYFKGLYKIINK